MLPAGAQVTSLGPGAIASCGRMLNACHGSWGVPGV